MSLNAICLKQFADFMTVPAITAVEGLFYMENWHGGLV